MTSENHAISLENAQCFGETVRAMQRGGCRDAVAMGSPNHATGGVMPSQPRQPNDSPESGSGATPAVECPRCLGSRESVGIACGRKTGGHIISIPCVLCGGTGSIPRAQLVWIESGKAIHAMRCEMYVGLRECALAIKVKPSELSDAEFGRVDPAPIAERVAAFAAQRKATTA